MSNREDWELTHVALVDDINQTPWEAWWVCFLAIAHAAGKDPGQPEMWRQDNWARNQTPQEAFDAEYGDYS